MPPRPSHIRTLLQPLVISEQSLAEVGLGLYKGTLDLKNGATDVTIKVESDASQRSTQQFLTEVLMINLMVYDSDPHQSTK